MVLPNCNSVGEPAAVDAAEQAVDIAASSEIRTQARLDLADALLLLRGDLDAADRALRRGEADMEVRWFHNRWRCEQRTETMDFHSGKAAV